MDCDEGKLCGDVKNEKSNVEYKDCLKHAKKENSYGFAFRENGDGLCRLCTQEQFSKKEKQKGWAMYIKYNDTVGKIFWSDLNGFLIELILQLEDIAST